jgi:acyl carrier protein
MNAPNREQIRATIFEVLSAIAPETEPANLEPDEPLREQVDLDSFDFLNVIIALHERLGVDIPETDYGKLDTLEHIADYLVRRCAARETPPA